MPPVSARKQGERIFSGSQIGTEDRIKTPTQTSILGLVHTYLSHSSMYLSVFFTKEQYITVYRRYSLLNVAFGWRCTTYHGTEHKGHRARVAGTQGVQPMPWSLLLTQSEPEPSARHQACARAVTHPTVIGGALRRPFYHRAATSK